MNDLFEYLKNNGDLGWGYSPENAVYDAAAAGLVNTVKFIDSVEIDERRWGRTTQFVYELDNRLIAIQVYVMDSENGEDLFEDVYEVEPYDVVVTRYRRTK